jgi:hypothetical protein
MSGVHAAESPTFTTASPSEERAPWTTRNVAFFERHVARERVPQIAVRGEGMGRADCQPEADHGICGCRLFARAKFRNYRTRVAISG